MRSNCEEYSGFRYVLVLSVSPCVLVRNNVTDETSVVPKLPQVPLACIFVDYNHF